MDTLKLAAQSLAPFKSMVDSHEDFDTVVDKWASHSDASILEKTFINSESGKIFKESGFVPTIR